MLLSAILCFIDQRVASLLYHHFKGKLKIHKRFFAKFFCTTIVVIFQIIFDKDCSVAKKPQSPIDQTELNEIKSTQHNNSTSQPLPSFNLGLRQHSTPKFPKPKTSNLSNTNRPTSNIHVDTNEIQIHQEQTDSVTDFFTARETAL
jgi:hypothetical protein